MEGKCRSQTNGISKLEALWGSAQRDSVTCSKLHSKLRMELGWTSSQRIPGPKHVLVCCGVCILRAMGMEWGRLERELTLKYGEVGGPGRQGRCQMTLAGERWNGLGPRYWVPEGWLWGLPGKRNNINTSVGDAHLLFVFQVLF